MSTERTSTDASITEKGNIATLDLSDKKLHELDVAVLLATEPDDRLPAITPEESNRILRKIDWCILPLLGLIYTVQFIDKSTLSSSSILGLIADNHLTASDFNNLASAFYIGYLVFAWPQSWALQHFPVGRWLTINIFLWCLFLGLHPVCHNFGGLFILRFLLGASEGCMNAGLMVVCGMYYTRAEVSERIGWTYQCNGLAVIISGFMQFGLVHVSPKAHPRQWQWLMIITTIATLLPCVLFLLFFPDNPTTARFLKPEERILAVRRVRENQNGIETKAWKRYQFVEALQDPKTWLYFLLMTFGTLTGGVAVQYALLINSFGFTLLQTTLLGIPNGFAIIISVSFFCYLVRRHPNSRSWISIISWTPSILACLMQILIPFRNKVAHLVAVYLTSLGTSAPLVLSMSWVVSNTSGHTKKMTTIAVTLLGTSLGNTLGPQFWVNKYKPEDHVPWGIILMANLVSIACTLALRLLFSRENKQRESAKEDARKTGVGLEAFDDYMILDAGTTRTDGKVVEQKVDKMFLDLTDTENKAFRYVL